MTGDQQETKKTTLEQRMHEPKDSDTDQTVSLPEPCPTSSVIHTSLPGSSLERNPSSSPFPFTLSRDFRPRGVLPG